MIALALQAALAFNLVCTGTESVWIQGQARELSHSRTYSRTYRIDLARGRWCHDDCPTTSPVVWASPDVLVLREQDDESVDMLDLIHRDTGQHIFYAAARGPGPHQIVSWLGRCERAPFTGLPEPRF